MKCLYFGNFNFVQGVASVIRAIGVASLLHEAGYSTSIFVKNYDGSLDSSAFLLENDCKIVSKPCTSTLSDYLSSSEYIKWIRLVPDVKLVVLYDFPFPPFMKIRRYCIRHGIKVISDVTEWFDSKNLAFYKRPIKRFDTFLRMHIDNEICDGLIVISPFLYSYYRHKTSSPLICIPPLMDFGVLSYKGTATVPFYRERLDIGFVGRTGKGKDDLSTFLEALVSISDPRIFFHIAGTAKLHFRKQIRESKYFSNNVIFEGNLSHEQALGVLRGLNYQVIFRKPSRQNRAGFSTKFAESSAFGVPCICSSFGDFLTLVVDGKNGYLLPQNKEELIAKMTEISDSYFSKNSVIDSGNLKEYFLASSYLSAFRGFINSVCPKSSDGSGKSAKANL